MLPRVFVPDPDAESVRKLKETLGVAAPSTLVKVSPDPTAKARNCFITVRDKVNREGGRVQVGWLVWQHSNLFIEAEHHAVFDPGDGQPCVDLTPQSISGQNVYQIVFIPDDRAVYDYDTTQLRDNVRVPLLDDYRLLEALKLLSEKTRLLNSVPGIDVQVPQPIARQIYAVEMRAASLITDVMASQDRQSFAGERVGRNAPCPCGSGKKFKKCCGS